MVEITVKGDPKEIAALVVALQERQEEIVLDREALLDSVNRFQSEQGRIVQ